MNENTWLKVRNLREGSLVGVEPLTGFEIVSLRALAAEYDAAIATRQRQKARYDNWLLTTMSAGALALVGSIVANDFRRHAALELFGAALFSGGVALCAAAAAWPSLLNLIVRPPPTPLQPIEDNDLRGGWLNDVAPHDYAELDTLMTTNGPARAYASVVLASGRELTIFELDALRTAHKRAQQDIERAHATSKGQDVRRALAAGL